MTSGPTVEPAAVGGEGNRFSSLGRNVKRFEDTGGGDACIIRSVYVNIASDAVGREDLKTGIDRGDGFGSRKGEGEDYKQT